MQLDGPWIYFVSMAIIILEGCLLSRILPFHRAQCTKELGMRRVVPVDGLRGILALSVFFYHSNLFFIFESKAGDWPPTTSNFNTQLGVLPVTMFFFITGYVFWLKMIKNASIPMGPFLYARLGRLGGVYVFACLLCFTLIGFQSHFHRNESVGLLIAQGLSWLLFFGAGHDINHIQLSKVWLIPSWTLRLEWLFYLSLPFLGWFARRVQRLPLIPVIAGTGAYLLGVLNLRFTPHSAPYAVMEILQG
jgi:peptidoglycan/LPS O-acetylase OafA/YrhL